jgi:anti-anti-sigma factor
MNEGHWLHEVRIDGADMSPAGAFTIASRPAPPDVALIELAGELDIAATSALRSYVDEAADRRGLVLDLSGATFVDSSMLKELLRANAELARDDTKLVLSGISPVVRRVLELTRTIALFTIVGDRDEAVLLVAS